MADLKKKFIDILFEEDYDEEELVKDYAKEKVVPKQEVKSDSGYNAKDILYRKPGGSAFINLYDEPKIDVQKEKDIEEAKQEYEMSSQISPIFGVLKEGEKKNNVLKTSVDKAVVDKPDDSHLDIVTSPIYGYGNGSNQVRFESVDSEIEENEEEQLHNLFDEKQDFDTNSEEEKNEDLNLFRLFGEKE